MLVDRNALCRIEESVLAPYAVRSSASRGRVHAEDEHPVRTAFQRDRDRIIHSTAFRRLEYKTQVFVNYEGDYYRTRLTHTIETAQIARTMARTLGLNTDLVEAVALAHDLGHTPFGHAGERVLNRLMTAHGGFEHNEQSLRVVDVLETRYPGHSGLNLTWEVREGIVKHSPPYDKPLAGAFEQGRAPALEAQIVDLADEIAYLAHDVDDGVRSGLLTLHDLAGIELWDRADAAAETVPTDDRLRRHHGVRALIDVLAMDLIRCTAERISQRSITTPEAVRRRSEPLVAFSAKIEESRLALKSFLYERLYNHHRVVRMTRKAQQLLERLFTAYAHEPTLLPPHILKRSRYRADPLERAVADYIAGMTDRFAIQEYERLFDPRVRA